MHKRDEIIEAIKKCAAKLGRAPSQAEFRRASKISWYQVYKHFRGMRQAVRAAGLEPGPRGGALDVNALTLDWAGVVRKLGRLPSRAEYCEHGIHHAGTLHARIVWSQMAHKFVLLVKEFHLEREWADVVKIVVGKFPLLELAKPFTAKDAQPPHQAKTGLAGGPGDAKEEERKTYHGDTETRRAAEAGEKEGTLGPSLAVKASLVQDDNVPPHQARTGLVGGPGLRRGDFAPRDFDRGGMRLGKVVAAALAIEILMAAQRSTQQSALSIQPEESNWQLANSNWQEQNQEQNKDQNKDQNLEPQRTQRNTEESTVVADWRRETQIGEVGRELTRIDANQDFEPQRVERNTQEMHALEDAHGLCAGGRAPCGRPVVYGEPLGLAAMAHAPTNELGVLFLFGIVAADLGFRVERLQAAFPDCEAKREVAPGKWELVLLELEIYSRNFKSHRHDPRGCHGIVCWKHNWPDCPEWLEVIELSKVVKRLGDRE